MSLSPPTLISSGGRSAAIATLVSAFAADPVERRLYPADEEYERHFPEFACAFGGRAFEGGTAWGLEGIAPVAPLAGAVQAESALTRSRNDTRNRILDIALEVLGQSPDAGMGHIASATDQVVLDRLGDQPVGR
jgi:hypothetical protein